MIEHLPRPLLALLIAVMPLTLSAQQDTVMAGMEATGDVTAPQPQSPEAAPAIGGYRPMAEPQVPDFPPREAGYDPMQDPGHGWAREDDYAYGSYGYGAYPAAPPYGGEPDYGYDPGYYGYPQGEPMPYPDVPPQAGYRQGMMRGGYAEPYPQAYGAAPARMPRGDYHHDMIQRLDAIIDRLERIERALQSRGD